MIEILIVWNAVELELKTQMEYLLNEHLAQMNFVRSYFLQSNSSIRLLKHELDGDSKKQVTSDGSTYTCTCVDNVIEFEHRLYTDQINGGYQHYLISK